MTLILRLHAEEFAIQDTLAHPKRLGPWVRIAVLRITKPQALATRATLVPQVS